MKQRILFACIGGLLAIIGAGIHSIELVIIGCIFYAIGVL
jgi:hypothetical protein